MISELANTAVYTDFEGLAELRGKSRENSPEALKAAAKQFEALFMQMMLKSMRDAGETGGEGEDNLFESDQTRMYRDMHDKQLALNMADGQGIGLADMLVRQLQGVVEHTVPTGQRQTFAVPERQPFTAAPVQAGAVKPTSPDPVGFDSPEAFVRELWPHAQKAAQQLGVDPRALLAQAALETGWGKAVIRAPDGSSSYNLFNIKADHRWSGERVVKQTLEYRDGVAVQERAPFRAYDSYAESFEDYVAFLSGNARYQGALEKSGDAGRFVEELHRAGYATDPAYATKIKRIIGSDVLAGFKPAATQTIT